MNRFFVLKKWVAISFTIASCLAVLALGNLKFSFDFSQFFPEGDEDLVFYQEFSKEFGTDDNFLLIAIENDPTVFDTDFLKRFHRFSLESKKMPYVTQSRSLTTLSYPLKTSFGYTPLPIIHREDPTKLQTDWKKIQEDDLFINALIDSRAKSMVLALETNDELTYDQSVRLLTAVRKSLAHNSLPNYHLLGRSYFFEALVQMQKQELIVTSITSTLLVVLILFLIYRKPIVVAIAIFTIIIALLLFLGLLSLLGKELNAMAAFYPILILIVGTSDVVHVMDHFLAKLQDGKEKKIAMRYTLKTVGLSTLLTSITTAVGFVSLLTSKSSSIADFGVNSAIGVIVAYITTIGLTSSLLLLSPKKRLLVKKRTSNRWKTSLLYINALTQKWPKTILTGSIIFTGICILGVFRINTNHRFIDSLPKKSAIAKDFGFFQKNYAGFRPLEIAVTAKKGNKVTDFSIAVQMDKVEKELEKIKAVQNIQSVNTLYKSVHKAHNLNKTHYFKLAETEDTFEKYKTDIKKFARKRFYNYVNASETKARIQTKVLDIGTDSLSNIYKKLNRFIAKKTDTSIVDFKLTGKGLLLDKNALYIKNSLLEGLLLATIVIGLLMVILFKNIKLLLISLLPNVLPLLFAGALLGYLGISLEATVSVVFAIVFGIAVDDTIHFLSNYKLHISLGLSKEEALEETFKKTGRALVITTLLLFFGFMIMLFSVHGPSVTVGLLISITLLTALVLDLLLIPVLIRKLL